eukprot:TRINITY_DN10652_c3_g1_i1.p1 TRINITY_DN10652_c3_g1~~TRINITY_DN10652_c3_g1_i1.p1  ORF type:complete len:503 (+),score=81.41 TRINITY_DN10652_c3_g1_i1:53-1510(+)
MAGAVRLLLLLLAAARPRDRGRYERLLRQDRVATAPSTPAAFGFGCDLPGSDTACCRAAWSLHVSRGSVTGAALARRAGEPSERWCARIKAAAAVVSVGDVVQYGAPVPPALRIAGRVAKLSSKTDVDAAPPLPHCSSGPGKFPAHAKRPQCSKCTEDVPEAGVRRWCFSDPADYEADGIGGDLTRAVGTRPWVNGTHGSRPWFSGHAAETSLSRLRFSPHCCKLMPCSESLVRRFFRCHRGRRIAFVGDSVQNQLGVAFVSVLSGARASTREETHDLWTTFKFGDGFEVHLVEFSYFDGAGLQHVVRTMNLTSCDIVVASFGMWFNLPGEDLPKALNKTGRYKDFVGSVASVGAEAAMPMLIWTETPAQHFAGGDGGVFPTDLVWPKDARHTTAAAAHHLTSWCAARGSDPGYWNDWRRQRSTPVMEAAGFPILRIWNLSTKAPWAAGFRGHDWVWGDCTHPVTVGMPALWADVLFTMLQFLPA